MRGKLIAIGRAVLGIGLVGYILFGFDNGIDGSLFIGAAWLFAALPILALVGGAVEAIRLRLLCKSQRANLEFWHGLRLVLVSVFFNFFVPGGTGGDVAKIYYLAADNPGKGVEFAVVVFVDRVTGMLAMIITAMMLALPNILLVSEYPVIQWLLGMLAVLLAGVIGVMLIFYWETSRKSRLFVYVLDRLPLNRYIKRAVEAADSFRDHKRALVLAVAVSVLGNGVMILMFLIASKVFMPEAPAPVVCFLAVLGMFANAVPLTPGGLGVGEAAFAGLFGLLGISSGAMLMVSWRVGMLPLALIGGLYYIAGVRRKPLRDIQSSAG